MHFLVNRVEGATADQRANMSAMGSHPCERYIRDVYRISDKYAGSRVVTDDCARIPV
jgi:hypothetical protein